MLFPAQRVNSGGKCLSQVYSVNEGDSDAGRNKCRRNEKIEEWNMMGILMTSIYLWQDAEIKGSRVLSKDSDMAGKASRNSSRLYISSATASASAPLPNPTLSALCDVCLCPLGATISPSNSFQSGIHIASPIPFSDSPKPGLLQRDRQLVRQGEVAFEVPSFAEASLFAHIKAEDI